MEDGPWTMPARRTLASALAGGDLGGDRGDVSDVSDVSDFSDVSDVSDYSGVSEGGDPCGLKSGELRGFSG